jgi:hypothetical protein
MQFQVMLPSLQAMDHCKESFSMGWPPSLATIQVLALINNWPSILHEHSRNGKVTSIRMHLKGIVKPRLIFKGLSQTRLTPFFSKLDPSLAILEKLHMNLLQ